VLEDRVTRAQTRGSAVGDRGVTADQTPPSWTGMGISAAAILVMPLLAWRKRAVNRTIQSPALRADIAESITCAYMAGADRRLLR
jgi:divalent metal cation (Fe/Co/Zn/Cd) transporter